MSRGGVNFQGVNVRTPTHTHRQTDILKKILASCYTVVITVLDAVLHMRSIVFAIVTSDTKFLIIPPHSHSATTSLPGFPVLKKTIFYAEIFKILFRKFTWRHRSTLLCSNSVKFVLRKIGKIVRYLVDKKFSCLSNCRYCADRAQNEPVSAPDNVLRVF